MKPRKEVSMFILENPCRPVKLRAGLPGFPHVDSPSARRSHSIAPKSERLTVRSTVGADDGKRDLAQRDVGAILKISGFSRFVAVL